MQKEELLTDLYLILLERGPGYGNQIEFWDPTLEAVEMFEEIEHHINYILTSYGEALHHEDYEKANLLAQNLELIEKQNPKKPEIIFGKRCCPRCKTPIKRGVLFCSCGQLLEGDLCATNES